MTKKILLFIDRSKSLLSPNVNKNKIRIPKNFEISIEESPRNLRTSNWSKKSFNSNILNKIKKKKNFDGILILSDLKCFFDIRTRESIETLRANLKTILEQSQTTPIAVINFRRQSNETIINPKSWSDSILRLHEEEIQPESLTRFYTNRSIGSSIETDINTILEHLDEIFQSPTE